VFVGFSRIFLLGILIFKGLTAQRLYKSFGVKGLITTLSLDIFAFCTHFSTSAIVNCGQRIGTYQGAAVPSTDLHDTGVQRVHTDGGTQKYLLVYAG
jgi:hypothetical protein